MFSYLSMIGVTPIHLWLGLPICSLLDDVIPLQVFSFIVGGLPGRPSHALATNFRDKAEHFCDFVVWTCHIIIVE